MEVSKITGMGRFYSQNYVWGLLVTSVLSVLPWNQDQLFLPKHSEVCLMMMCQKYEPQKEKKNVNHEVEHDK